MGNIMDYIEWRGDLPFTQSEFNDVDNLILACFPMSIWMGSRKQPARME